MTKLYGYVSNMGAPEYDDIMQSDLPTEEKVKQIQMRGQEYRDEVDRNYWKNMGRIGLGTGLSVSSFLPVFNIPYVGTGLGGAMYDAGQAIVEGDKLGDIAKRAGRGFVIGETVGAIPYVGKGVNKLSGGKIGNAVDAVAEKVAANPAVQKAYDALMTNIDGNTLKGFHGTNAKFKNFDADYIGTNTGNDGYSGYGFYFADSPQEAETYGNNIMKRYVDIKKPFIPERDNLAKYAENFGYSKEPIAVDSDWLLNNLKDKDVKAYDLAKEIIENGDEKGWENFLSKYDGTDNVFDLNMVANWARDTKIDQDIYKQPLSDYTINELKNKFGDIKTVDDFKYLPSLDYFLDVGKHSKEFTNLLKKDGYDGVINGSEFVAFSPEQIRTDSLKDYLTNDSVLTKGYRENKAKIDNTIKDFVETQKRKSDIADIVSKRKDWGIAYQKASGNPELAIETLLKEKKGFVPKAFYKEGIGDIDLVWGEHNYITDEGYGLEHILARRGKQGIDAEQFVRELPDTIKNGVITKDSRFPTRRYIEDVNKKISIELNWNKKRRKWIVTAFRQNKSAKKH